MRQGKVKWYNGKKCFGFISPDTPNADGNTDDVFVHSSSLKAAGIRFLNENDIVEFEEEVRNGKLSATFKSKPHSLAWSVSISITLSTRTSCRTSSCCRRSKTARRKICPSWICVLEEIKKSPSLGDFLNVFVEKNNFYTILPMLSWRLI